MALYPKGDKAPNPALAHDLADAEWLSSKQNEWQSPQVPSTEQVQHAVVITVTPRRNQL